MAVALGGLDALAFTAGIGEHSPEIRSAIVRRLNFLNLDVDERVNRGVTGDTKISAASASVPVYVIPAREDVVVARGVRTLI